VFERAVRKLAEAIKARGTPERIILLAQPEGRGEVDSQFTGRESELALGHIPGIGTKKGWTAYWNPGGMPGGSRRSATLTGSHGSGELRRLWPPS
jgi:hypothetical protein